MKCAHLGGSDPHATPAIFVSTAESAEEAEALLANGARPDLAILDVQMPGTDGLTLAQRLRDFEHLPFVMLSAYSDAASVEPRKSISPICGNHAKIGVKIW